MKIENLNVISVTEVLLIDGLGALITQASSIKTLASA